MANPTKAEKQLHDRMASLGCIACREDGIVNTWVSIHHIDGRTKPGAHKRVIPLCGPHHQDNGTAIAVHPYKARFEARYGSQESLLEKTMELLRL